MHCGNRAAQTEDFCRCFLSRRDKQRPSHVPRERHVWLDGASARHTCKRALAVFPAFVTHQPHEQSSQVTIDNIRKAINLPNPKPIFGICLGNQLLALAAGLSTSVAQCKI